MLSDEVEFDSFIQEFEVVCQLGDVPLHTLAARALLAALGRCCEGRMQDCHRDLLRAAEKDGRLTAAPEQVYDTVVKRLRQMVTQGGNNQRVARGRRGVPGSEARLRVCRELLTRGACSQGDLCLHDHDPARVQAGRRTCRWATHTRTATSPLLTSTATCSAVAVVLAAPRGVRRT